MKLGWILWALPVIGQAADPTSSDIRMKIPITVTAQRAGPGGSEQITIKFDTYKAYLELNSNFLTAANSYSTWLGSYSTPMEQGLQIEHLRFSDLKKKLDQDQMPGFKMSKQMISSSDPRSPTATPIQIFLNERELEKGSYAYDTAFSLLSQAWTIARWSAEKGVDVRFIGRNSIQTSYFGEQLSANERTVQAAPKESFQCQQLEGLNYRCQVSGYGSAYLQAQPEQMGRAVSTKLSD